MTPRYTVHLREKHGWQGLLGFLETRVPQNWLLQNLTVDHHSMSHIVSH